MLRPCATHGCPTLTRSTYCDSCRKANRKPDTRPSASQRGYGAKWRRTRAEYLRTHPICESEHGCIQPATDVDHIDGQGPKGPKGHDADNLRALCHSHHSQRTARDQPGGWNA